MNNPPSSHRFKLTIEYDGSSFVGWQIQPRGRSVQGTIKRALEEIFKTSIKLEGSGRTDSGVHALGQVAAVSAGTRMDADELHRALGSTLPTDIRIIKVEEVQPSFNPRRDADGRWYRYYVRRNPTVFERRFCLHLPQELNQNAMEKAAGHLIGSHDFTAFTTVEEQGDRRRTLWALDLNFHDEGLEIDALGPSFLHKMVRMIVGSLLGSGRGKITLQEIEEVLQSGDIKRAGPTAPPQGLFLMKVFYPPQEPQKLYLRQRKEVGNGLPPKISL